MTLNDPAGPWPRVVRVQLQLKTITVAPNPAVATISNREVSIINHW